MSVGTFIKEGEIGILAIDSPPVNALGMKVRTALCEGLSQLGSDPEVKAIVVICRGRTFFAGADISELGQKLDGPDLGQVLRDMEGAPKPVIAAIHGTALGGGYEVSMCCHYRIAVPSAKVGLPEVKLGLLPGGQGTQRLPRIVGAAAALEIMVGGDPIPAPRALELGMIDALAEEGKLQESAIAYARSILAAGQPIQRVRDREDKIAADRGNSALFDDFRRRNARAFRGFKAPELIVRAVEAAVSLPFDEGHKRERALFEELRDSPESAAQRYFFFAERGTSKIPDVPITPAPLDIARVAIIGAGTMGGGIAMSFLNAGIPVILSDTRQEALENGVAVIRRNYEASARRGKLTAEALNVRMKLLTASLDDQALGEADLIIEAAFEDMAVKKQIFARLDAVAKPGAILATNTSYLDVDEIAASTSRPDSVLGLHFFSPANVMRLLEVVRGKETAVPVIERGIKLAKALGKVPVVSRVCHGFIANRVMAARNRQADALLLEGATPQQVDEALYDYGFAMGPFRMRDLAGLDVTPPDPTTRTVRGELLNLGRRGQKTGSGYYDYDDSRNASPSPVTAGVIADIVAERGGPAGATFTAEEIVARLLYPVVNEGAKLLEEGIALRAADIDVACILGYSWPIFTGGPMFWADRVGLSQIVDGLERLAQSHGGEFAPTALLRKMAAEGNRFTS